MNVKEKIVDFMKNTQILSLATTDGVDVSVCNLHYSSDEDLNLYFVSNPEKTHCKNIEKHPEVSVCIYDPATVSDTVVTGIQLKGSCMPFTDQSGREHIKAFYEKFPEKYNGEIKELIENYDFRSVYKIVPTWIRVIDGRSWDLPYEITL